jgi:hypothetical protein
LKYDKKIPVLISEYTYNDSLKVFQEWNAEKYSILPESDTRFFINNSELLLEFEIENNSAINRFFIPSQNIMWERIPSLN